MRMAELSRRTATPVATIKYYIREGLLPPGEHTAANQAEYGPDHVARVELIRSLREVAGLPIATIKETFDAIDRARTDDSGPDPLHIAFRSLSSGAEVPTGDADAFAAAAAKVDGVLRDLGWCDDDDSGVRAHLIRAVAAIDRHFPGGVTPETLRSYATTAQRLAELEIPDEWDPASAPTDTLRYAVLGTVLFEPVILALRRMAHAQRHRRLRDSRRRR